MLFNTIQFVAFFAAFVAAYWTLRTVRQRSLLLLIGGYFFYGCWNPWFLALLAFSTLWDYFVGLALVRPHPPRVRKLILVSSIAVNLGLLGCFKYFNFFSHSLHDLLAAAGIHTSLATLNVILPVGISFYTFVSMSYAIDVYRGKQKAETNLLSYAVFVAFWPQLVAGPIERASHLLVQVERPKAFDYANFVAGLELMAWGFFKKMFVADNVAMIADYVFSTPVDEQSGGQVLLGLYAFAIQIYGDFSGYSDIARGAARCLGFELMMNFRTPYFATNPPEFWQRWHISLSSWLRDYLYIPLGGNRGGPIATYRNLAITMLLGGLWHGAAWTFVLWGGYHGLILIIHRLWDRRVGPPRDRGPALNSATWLIRVVFFFHVTCLGWLFFRATSAGQCVEMLVAIFQDPQIGQRGLFYLRMIAFYSIIMLLADAWWYRRQVCGHTLEEMPVLSTHSAARAGLAIVAISSVLLYGSFDSASFIYFQF